jgi:TonB family protein
MRCLIFAIAFLVSTAATTDESTFRQQLSRHLTENSRAFPEKLKDRRAEVDVTLTIDRGGKLVNVSIDHSTGSPEDNEDVRTGLRRMQPFPNVPDDLQAPYKIEVPLTFIPIERLAFVNFKASGVTSTSEKEIAFRREILKRLYLYDRRPVLPSNIKKPEDARPIIMFSIDRDGKLLNARVTKSFGVKTVDDETLTWFKKVARFPSVPPELNAPMTLTAEIVFGLPASSNEGRIKR